MPLYHYTNVNAVNSILSGSKMWFTDLRYLNDSSELKDGISVFMKSFDKWTGSLWTEDEYAHKALNYLREELSVASDGGIPEEIQCACSFSRAYNQLSQWRAYGSYIVEFDERELLTSLAKLHNCVYYLKEKQDIALMSVTKSIEVVSKDMKQRDGCAGINSLDELTSLYERAATFKDEGFVEEDEVRALIRVEETDEMVKYRIKGDLMIPYIEMQISLDSIKAIHVGPMNNQDLAYKSMCCFVRNVEKQYQNECGNIEYEIEVMVSSIPYRTL